MNRENRDLTKENEQVNIVLEELSKGSPSIKENITKLNQYSLYPVKSAFSGIPLFDERFNLGSDREHNLPSKLKKVSFDANLNK